LGLLCCAGTGDFCSALAALVQKYFSLTTHYLNLLSLSDWAGSRAGSPVSQYVSPGGTEGEEMQEICIFNTFEETQGFFLLYFLFWLHPLHHN
jgi:hypothetical protein